MALFKGIVIILLVISVNVIAAFIETGSTAAPTIKGCSSTGNFTSCQNTSKTDFLSSLFSVAVTGINNAPTIFNVLYVTILGILLIAGIIEIVRSFVPTLPGG